MKTRFSHAAAFGAVASFAVIALALILYLANFKNSALNYLSYPITITIACIALKKWREQSGGYLTFGQAYVHLLFQTLIYAAIITVWTLVFMIYIAPGLIEDQMLVQQAKMEDDGMSQQQIDMAMHYARMFTSPGLIAVFAFFGNILINALINLVIAAGMKKDPPPAQFMPPGYTEHINTPPQDGQQYSNNPYQQNFPPQQNNPPQQ